jgi:hypothetical protein
MIYTSEGENAFTMHKVLQSILNSLSQAAKFKQIILIEYFV